MDHIFGPVNSRRLGVSLGIDLLPPKICNFNCIYCEVGPTTTFTNTRGEYTSTAAIIAEIDAYFADAEAVARLDILTITASGEPTLHSGLGAIIAHLKQISTKPVAVLTNGSLLYLPEVRRELAKADVVVPSLDAARQESYRRIDRPAAECDLERLIGGLVDFSREFTGRCWLEILLARGINDAPEDLAALAVAVERIQPERIQLNTVARPPLETFALPLSLEQLRAAATCFQLPVDILTDRNSLERGSDKSEVSGRQADQEDILHLLQRRPCPADDLAAALGIQPDRAAALLTRLVASGQVKISRHRDRDYYVIAPRERDQKSADRPPA
ncbi:MAG TPA: radical SAM protein [Desulfurivibrio alkaliphilus]|uniref:Radical SAM protein n=1 Tax=Desulfurivibrio alkaliphilus TaxID=427923 RepID=A0A7C2TGV5_9BACT|nr:radical SAM protein [Desulfurivibrio alkaliphilus]